MKTIFLDRDGVINEDSGYVHNWDKFKFIDGSLKALQLLTKNNFNIIIVTNQAGIAKGFYTEIDFKNLSSEFLRFCSQNKIKIMDTFYCPHHIDGVI
ncbi:HAD-IIIA family hydrolase, partial [Pseudomonadota bacterium]|nr:HAD-IIIA family hydrolase [Pseudomonadota bacterium]